MPSRRSSAQRDQHVREPRVLRQQRAVQVGADQAAAAHALGAVVAVVAEARHDAAQRLLAVAEVRAAAVVLEAGELLAGRRRGRPRSRRCRSGARPARGRCAGRPARARAATRRPELVGVAQQLVAAADREHRGAGVERPRRARRAWSRPGRARPAPGRGPGRRRCRRGRARRGSIGSPGPAPVELEADPAPRAAALEHGDVPAVGVDVHVVRVEPQDPQRRRQLTRRAPRARRRCPRGRRWRGIAAPRRRAQAGRSHLALELRRESAARGGPRRSRRHARRRARPTVRSRSSEIARAAVDACGSPIGWLREDPAVDSRMSGRGAIVARRPAPRPRGRVRAVANRPPGRRCARDARAEHGGAPRSSREQLDELHRGE